MMSDQTWIERLSGDDDAREEALAELRQLLLRRLGQSVLGGIGVDDDFKEDIAQETLITVLSRLEQFEGRSRFTTWATTIAIRKALTELRRHRWKDVSLQQLLKVPEGREHLTPSNDPTPAASSERRDLINSLYMAIQSKLTPRQRDALLAELKGMPQEEIGRRLGSSRNAVYKLTHDARKRLKLELEALGYSSADLQLLQGQPR